MTQEQFTQTYLPLSGKMYALAYNLLRNRDEARDCVQDVYADLWDKRDTIKPDKPPLRCPISTIGRLLSRIALHLCLNTIVTNASGLPYMC